MANLAWDMRPGSIGKRLLLVGGCRYDSPAYSTLIINYFLGEIMQLFKVGASLCALLLLSACASGLKQGQVLTGYKYAGQKFSTVSVELNDVAAKQLTDNIKFNKDALKSTLERTLTSRGLIDPKSKNIIKVSVTDIRVRSTFAAVMFGFMAGSDSLEGKVIPTVSEGTKIPEFELSASYALGGFGGGQDESRMNWLYEEFSKITADTILTADDKVAKN